MRINNGQFWNPGLIDHNLCFTYTGGAVMINAKHVLAMFLAVMALTGSAIAQSQRSRPQNVSATIRVPFDRRGPAEGLPRLGMSRVKTIYLTHDEEGTKPFLPEHTWDTSSPLYISRANAFKRDTDADRVAFEKFLRRANEIRIELTKQRAHIRRLARKYRLSYSAAKRLARRIDSRQLAKAESASQPAQSATAPAIIPDTSLTTPAKDISPAPSPSPSSTPSLRPEPVDSETENEETIDPAKATAFNMTMEASTPSVSSQYELVVLSWKVTTRGRGEQLYLTSDDGLIKREVSYEGKYIVTPYRDLTVYKIVGIDRTSGSVIREKGLQIRRLRSRPLP
jgi:hypothetical protein